MTKDDDLKMTKKKGKKKSKKNKVMGKSDEKANQDNTKLINHSGDLTAFAEVKVANAKRSSRCESQPCGSNSVRSKSGILGCPPNLKENVPKEEKSRAEATGMEGIVETEVDKLLGQVDKLLGQNEALKLENDRMQSELVRIKAGVEKSEERHQNNLKSAAKEVEKFACKKAKIALEIQALLGKKEEMAMEIQDLRSGKMEVERQLKSEQKRIGALEKELKSRVAEKDEVVRQNKALVVEKTGLQTQAVRAMNQLESVREDLLLEKSYRSAAEKKLMKMEEMVIEEARSEHAKRMAVEEELADSRQREVDLRDFVQQFMSAGEHFLKAGKNPSKLEFKNDVEKRAAVTQMGDVRESSGDVKCNGHERLVEKLLKRIKLPHISPEDCSRLVQKLRASKGGLSGLSMSVIEVEVRNMAMEEAELKTMCPICFDPMARNLIHCKQCNQAFHSRSSRYTN